MFIQVCQYMNVHDHCHGLIGKFPQFVSPTGQIITLAIGRCPGAIIFTWKQLKYPIKHYRQMLYASAIKYRGFVMD